MSIRRAFVAAVLVACSVVGAYAQDISGRWNAKFDTQVGEQVYTFDFMVKGGVLTGTAKGNLMGETPITDGKVDGKTITFVENATYEGMALRVVYTGTIVSATEIKFSRNVADIATEELVAMRAK
jgi:hypothetical protein